MIRIQLTIFLPNEIAFATSDQVYDHSILVNKKDYCCALCSRFLKLVGVVLESILVCGLVVGFGILVLFSFLTNLICKGI